MQITLLVYELEEKNEISYTGVILKRTLAVTRSTGCHRASHKLFIPTLLSTCCVFPIFNCCTLNRQRQLFLN